MSKTVCPHCNEMIVIYSRAEKFSPRSPEQRPYSGQLNIADALEMRANGKSYLEIGKKYRVSGERVRQVLLSYAVNRGDL